MPKVDRKPAATISFTTSANDWSATYDVGRVKSAAGGPSDAITLKYDSKTDAFALSGPQLNEEFGPDTTTSTYIEAKGKKTAGNVTQTLQLNWTCCAARAIVTNYVAKGSYRLADVDPATGLSQYRLIDFLYGYKSSDAAIPRVGGATFDLIVSGSRASNAVAVGAFPAVRVPIELSGSGTAIVDFGAGTLGIAGKTVGMELMGNSGASNWNTSFSGSAALTSGKNDFAGTFTASAGELGTAYSGKWSGAFFGSDGEEIGGQLFGSSNTLPISLTFIGAKSAKVGSADRLSTAPDGTLFKAVYTNAYLAANAPPLDSLRSAEQTNGTVTYQDAGALRSLQISTLEALLNSSVPLTNRTPSTDTPDLTGYGTAVATYDGKQQSELALFDDDTAGITFRYASFVRVAGTFTDVAGKVTSKGVGYVGFGLATPPDQLPRTGSATYAGRVFADLYAGDTLLAPVRGQSSLAANFASGDVNGYLDTMRLDTAGNATALGKYTFSGKLDVFSSSFTGSIPAAANPGSGTITGRFYGDSAQEYVAAFNVDAGNVGKIVGVSIGQQTAQ